MIYAFTGKTGSGKTFKMVALAYRQWLKGVDIYSNTILNFEKYGGKANTRLKRTPLIASLSNLFRKADKKVYPKRGRITYFEDINELLEVKNGLIMIDEAQVLFNARNWEALPYEFQYKLQQHRKHRLDLYVTTQNMGTIDITYRRLVQKWYHIYDVFALFWKRNPSWLTLHRVHEKDVDMLYTSVDDLKVETIHKSFFFISPFNKRLYDTFYDIGFKRFKTIWLNYFDTEKQKMERTFWIIPKNLKLKDALRESSLLSSVLDLSKSKSWKKR